MYANIKKCKFQVHNFYNLTVKFIQSSSSVCVVDVGWQRLKDNSINIRPITSITNKLEKDQAELESMYMWIISITSKLKFDIQFLYIISDCPYYISGIWELFLGLIPQQLYIVGCEKNCCNFLLQQIMWSHFDMRATYIPQLYLFFVIFSWTICCTGLCLVQVVSNTILVNWRKYMQCIFFCGGLLGFITLVSRWYASLFVISWLNVRKNPKRFIKLFALFDNVTLQGLLCQFCVCDNLFSLKFFDWWSL